MSTRLIFILFSAAISTSFQFGYHTGVINAPQNFISEFIRNVSDNRNATYGDSYVTTMTSLCVSGFLIGGMVGALLSGTLANKLGRQKSILFMSVPCFVGCVVLMTCTLANSFEMIIVGRFLIGLACGALTGIGPMYMSEVAPVSIRGAAGVLNQLVVVISLVLSQVLGLPGVMGTLKLWPYLLGLNIIPCVVGFVFIMFCPESPRYLYLVKRDTQAARQELERLRGPTMDVQGELDAYGKEADTQTEKTNVIDLFRVRYLRTAVLVVIFAQLGQQLSGMNGLLYYSVELFKANGLDDNQANYATIGIGGVLLAVTIVSIFVIDRVGRRALLIGGLTVALCCLIVFTCSMIGKQYGQINWPIYIALCSIYVFVCGFAIGPGSIPWFLAAEIFPQESRDAAVSVAVTVNWVCNIAVGLGFIQLIHYWGIYSFLPFVVILFISIGVLFFLMPETMGRSVSRIQMDLLRRSHFNRPLVSEPVESETTLNSEIDRVEDPPAISTVIRVHDEA